MKRLCVLVGAMTVASILAAPAKAQMLRKTVGSTVVNFPVPAGQCEVTDRTRPAAAFKKYMTEGLAVTGEILLSIHMDCGKLESYNAGKGATVETYALYSATSISINNFYTSDYMRRACAASKSLKGSEGDGFTYSGMSLTEPKQLGVLLEENDICYTGMVARVTRPNGFDQVFLAIGADVNIKGKLIKYKALFPFRDSQGVADNLNTHKANVAAFIAANTQL